MHTKIWAESGQEVKLLVRRVMMLTRPSIEELCSGGLSIGGENLIEYLQKVSHCIPYSISSLPE